MKNKQECNKLTPAEKYRMELIKHLSDPELPFPNRSQYTKIIGRTRKTLYEHFTPDDLSEIEKEAYENRKASCVPQRANVLKALYDRAMGFEHSAIHITNHMGKIIKTKIKKVYPPDRAAAQEFLDRVEGKVVEKKELDLTVKNRKFNLIFNSFNKDNEKKDGS